nr:response regulator [uncultured Oscillibacter sp.]
MMGAGYGRKRILAVDDAAFTLSRITDALGKHYEMVTVNSGTRALKYLSKNKPDLILLDIRMPVKDGFEILREIRNMEDRADIPIIMLTAMEDRQSVMKGIELGICDYVLKPFAPDDLLERVQRILKPPKTSVSGYGGESGQGGVHGQAGGEHSGESGPADGGKSDPADVIGSGQGPAAGG